MRRCYLVRHAQTAWNGENRIQGHSDIPLSPLGQQQAERLSRWFASRHLCGIFTSNLQRSRQTAHAIAAGLPAAPMTSGTMHGAAQAGNGSHRIEPVIEPHLAEIHLGAWEGLTPVEVDARFANAYQQWRVRPSSVVIPGGEPLGAFRERVREALSRILDGLGEGEYVLVSHGGVIAALLADLLSADYDLLMRRLRLDNAGVTAVEFGERPHVLWINATAHLDALAPAEEAGGWW
ncbi:MAG: histidine phosphatase family protein [Candidatus Omnitrophica bacterium]|nr:histidine phosphatase family protein [Candidatus Omnitrophota bacterium]